MKKNHKLLIITIVIISLLLILGVVLTFENKSTTSNKEPSTKLNGALNEATTTLVNKTNTSGTKTTTSATSTSTTSKTDTTKKTTTSKKTTKKSTKSTTKKPSTTKVTTTTEKKLSGTATKTPDYKIVKYTIDYEPNITTLPNPSIFNGYNNELFIKFEKPIVVDDYGYAAFMNYDSINNNISKLVRQKSTEKAKQMFGEDKDYCVQFDDYYYAKNKDNDIVGVVARAVIGTRAYTGWCDDNVTTVFLDNRIVLYQDDASNTFKNK